MPLNVVIELCKITKASKLFQRNFYLPLLEPLSPMDALRRQLITSEAQLQRMEHYIPVLEEYEKRQARRKLIVKGQVKKRQKKKASMRYVMPLLDMNMPGHAKLRNIFTRKSKGQGQCYTYRVPDKNCTLVITYQMERAIRDKDIIDLMVAQKNDTVVFVLKNNQKVSVPLVNYEGDAPFYRGDGWTKKDIESTHHYGKETMGMTRVFEGKEQKLEEWELDMMNMTALRKKKTACEDTQEWKALMATQVKDIDWELFESQVKQIVHEQYTPVEDQPIQMRVSSMENTMNVEEKLQKAGKSVLELLPTLSGIPKMIKQIKDEGQLVEIANVSGVKVKHMEKDYFIPGQMVKWDDSDLLVPGQTIFNENGDPEYVPGFTVVIEGNPKLIPGLVMGDDPSKPIFFPGTSTITESGVLQFTETEDDLPQELDRSDEDEEFEEKLLPSKRKVLESNLRPKREISEANYRELPDVVKDTEINVQVLPSRDEGNGGNEADDEVESENGDEMEDESESIASVIEVVHPPIDTTTSIFEKEFDEPEQGGKEGEMLEYSTKAQTTEFLGAEKRALEEENPSLSNQIGEGKETYKKVKPNENMKQGNEKVNERVTEKEEHEKGRKENTDKTNTKLLLEAEKTESEKVGEKCVMRSIEPSSEKTQDENQLREKFTDDDPLPIALTSDIKAVAKNSIIPPESDEEGSANETTEENRAGLKEQSENIRSVEEQVAKLEEMNDQFVQEGQQEQTAQEETTNEQLVEDQSAKQQTQKEHEANELAKGQIPEEKFNIKEASKTKQEDENNFAREQTAKKEEMIDQFVKEELKEQTDQEETAKEQLVKDRSAKQQTQKEHDANELTKRQIVKEKFEIKEDSKKQDVKGQLEEQTAGERLVEQVGKEEKVVERVIKDQAVKGQVLEEQAIDKQAAGQPASKVQPAEMRIVRLVEKNQALAEKEQATMELPANELAAAEQFKVAPAKRRMEDRVEKNKTSENPFAEEQATMELPTKEPTATEQTRKGMLKKGNADRLTAKDRVVDKQLEEDRTIKLASENQVKENAATKGREIEKRDGELPSKAIRPWSTVVKELFEVSVVVAGCYFINKLGKNVFNISI